MRRKLVSQSAVILIASLVTGGGVRAQDASPWISDLHTSLRLLAGTAHKIDGTPVRRAGIDILLEPGWKTYWRYPGDSGVPPTFDFSGSINVKSVAVLWPAPQKFPDGSGGHSIGYKDRVVLPLRVVPHDAGKPTTLRLKAAYGVCEKLCVPAEANAEIPLPGKASAREADLSAAEARVPRHTALGHGGSLAIRSVHREGTGADTRVVVAVTAPAGAPVELFVEGPTAALPLPEPIGPVSGTRHFAFKLDGLPSGAQARGARLTLTAVSGDSAIEVAAHLD